MKQLVSLVLLVGSATVAQPVPDWILHSPYGDQANHFGSDVSFIDDLTGDGVEDILIGARAEEAGAFGSGQVHVFDGSSLDHLFSLPSPNPEQHGAFGLVVGRLSDLDTDGYGDFFVCARWELNDYGRVYVFSGERADTLYTLHSPQPSSAGMFGINATAISDLDGDDTDDIIVSSLDWVGEHVQAGRVYAFSGATGGLLYELESSTPESHGYFGLGIAVLDDMNTDGIPDFALSDRYDNGRIHLYSGADGALIRTLLPPQDNPSDGDGFVDELIQTIDRDADGVADLITRGLYTDDQGERHAMVFVISSENGEVLTRIFPPDPTNDGHFGSAIAETDLNSDGVADVLIGSHYANGREGQVYVYDGGSFDLIETLRPTITGSQGYFGRNIVVPPNSSSSKWSVMIGAEEEDGPNPNDGHVYLYTSSSIVANEPEVGEVQRSSTLAVAPNPATETAHIRFELDRSQTVLIDVFDTLGRQIETVANRFYQAGTHELTWMPKTLPSGVYFIRVQSGDGLVTSKAITIR